MLHVLKGLNSVLQKEVVIANIEISKTIIIKILETKQNYGLLYFLLLYLDI